MSYAETIKKLRKKIILTQTEFAELLGVTFGTVNRWENGTYEPTIKIKRKLQQYFEKYKLRSKIKCRICYDQKKKKILHNGITLIGGSKLC